MRKLVHRFLYDAGHGVIVFVYGFAALEVGIGVLCRSAHDGIFGRQAALAVSAHELVVNHFMHNVERNFFDFLNFVRSAESVKKVNKRNARFKRRRMRYNGQIHNFLNAVRRDHRPSGLAARHYVLMVAENRQSARCDCTGGNVENGARQFSRNFVHIRNHQ